MVTGDGCGPPPVTSDHLLRTRLRALLRGGRRARLRTCLRLQVGDEPGGLFRKARLLAEAGRDLGDLLRRVIGREDRGLWRKVARRNALGRFVDDLELLLRL